ncbi:MAG: hypothetical protein ACPGWR_26575 [Ardenticatenaceae bacterium]
MRQTFSFVIAFLMALSIVAAIVLIILYATGTAHYVFDPVGEALERGNAGEWIRLSSSSGGLPATWTPRVTHVPTFPSSLTPKASKTPEGSNTPKPTKTARPTVTLILQKSRTTETPEPDDEATIVATQRATAEPSVTSPSESATNTPSPTKPAPPTTTPEPLYVLSELLGGADCQYVGFSGRVRGSDDRPREGITVELFNDSDYNQLLVTDQQGFYETMLDNQPRTDLAGNWHIRLLEEEIQVSHEIIVVMSESCENSDDLTRFVANFTRTK